MSPILDLDLDQWISKLFLPDPRKVSKVQEYDNINIEYNKHIFNMLYLGKIYLKTEGYFCATLCLEQIPESSQFFACAQYLLFDILVYQLITFWLNVSVLIDYFLINL